MLACNGMGREEFWSALEEGRSGIDYITRFDSTDLPCKIGGQLSEFDPHDFLKKADVYVNLSATGSLDKSVPEAIAAGLTVLTGNEAFENFLVGTKERTYLENVTAESVCRRLDELLSIPRQALQDDRNRLVKKVESEHALERLAKVMVSHMEQSL